MRRAVFLGWKTMLKQLFNKEQILKALTTKDIWRWKILDQYGNAESAAEAIVRNWNVNGLSIKGLDVKIIKGKKVYIPESLEDALAIRLVDRYLRRIYKVRQSDRSRMIKQVITLLQDPGSFTFIRLDISQCYESIIFEVVLNKLRKDLILSPDCINILESIGSIAQAQGNSGLLRGLSISATLAELYLEKLDKEISNNKNITYMARYVDDIIIFIPDVYAAQANDDIDSALEMLDLISNKDKSSSYKVDVVNESIELLGYSLSSSSSISKSSKKKNPNLVTVKISKRKLNKIKTRIVLSFLEYKKDQNFKILKDRIYFLSTLSVVKKGRNGDLLAGNAYNYFHASDSDCLKKIDGFYFKTLQELRFNLSSAQQSDLKKISFYGNAKNNKIMKVTKNKTIRLKQAWINE